MNAKDMKRKEGRDVFTDSCTFESFVRISMELTTAAYTLCGYSLWFH